MLLRLEEVTSSSQNHRGSSYRKNIVSLKTMGHIEEREMLKNDIYNIDREFDYSMIKILCWKR
jgi:hypothetical protein